MTEKNISIDGKIGKMMGELPSIKWLIMNRDESAYCISFDYRHEADDWMESQARSNHKYIEDNGYHVTRYENWPDYLGTNGDSAAACRFINFAVKSGVLDQPGAAEQVSKMAKFNQKIQVTLFGLMSEPAQIDSIDEQIV